MKKSPTPTSHPLVGKFFHILNAKGLIEWQGHIISHAGESGWFLVEFFSWLDGSPTHQQALFFNDTRGWFFYDTQEAMKAHYERAKTSEFTRHFTSGSFY